MVTAVKLTKKMSDMRLVAAICLSRYLFGKRMKRVGYVGNISGTKFLYSCAQKKYRSDVYRGRGEEDNSLDKYQ